LDHYQLPCRRYGYGSVGFNFFCSALVMLEAVLIIGAVQQGLGSGARVITLDMPLVIDATFCAGSAMIAFGAVLVSGGSIRYYCSSFQHGC
jgi:hypothetical protein